MLVVPEQSTVANPRVLTRPGGYDWLLLARGAITLIRASIVDVGSRGAAGAASGPQIGRHAHPG